MHSVNAMVRQNVRFTVADEIANVTLGFARPHVPPYLRYPIKPQYLQPFSLVLFRRICPVEAPR